MSRPFFLLGSDNWRLVVYHYGMNAEANRYLIYEMLRRQVKVDPKGFGKKFRGFDGVVEQVMRDVFENQVVLSVSGEPYAYDEPSLIFRHGNDIIFVYGDVDEFDDSDEALFDDVRASYGENIHAFINRSSPTCRKTLRFEVGEQAISKPLWGRRN